MKRIFMLVLALIMAAVLVACGNDEGDADTAMPTAVQEEGSTENDTNQATSVPAVPEETSGAAFVYNEDLQIIASFKYDSYLHVVVQNTGEQPILNFQIGYINFDRNGFTTTTRADGYEGGSASAVNLMPGEKSIYRWYSTDGDYPVVTALQVDYADGSQWNATNINYWVDETKNNFTVDRYNANIEALAADGRLAESNEYVSLDNYYLQHGNQFSSQHDLWFTITNKSDGR